VRGLWKALTRGRYPNGQLGVFSCRRHRHVVPDSGLVGQETRASNPRTQWSSTGSADPRRSPQAPKRELSRQDTDVGNWFESPLGHRLYYIDAAVAWSSLGSMASSFPALGRGSSRTGSGTDVPFFG
jgi:hypothetical protein